MHRMAILLSGLSSGQLTQEDRSEAWELLLRYAGDCDVSGDTAPCSFMRLVCSQYQYCQVAIVAFWLTPAVFVFVRVISPPNRCYINRKIANAFVSNRLFAHNLTCMSSFLYHASFCLILVTNDLSAIASKFQNQSSSSAYPTSSPSSSSSAGR